MRVTRLNLPKTLRNGDLVESHKSGEHYLIIKSPTSGYSVVCVSTCVLHNTNAETPEKAIERVLGGTYTIHKAEDFELVLN